MSLPQLAAGDFPAFFEAVHGYEPFPWQARLVRDIARCGCWPDLLDLPTGSGKTAAIDAAVFHLALEADRGEHRRAAMRIAFVVDRRLVVDDAYARAKKLARALAFALEEGAAPTAVRTVAERLSSPAPLLSSSGCSLLGPRRQTGSPIPDRSGRVHPNPDFQQTYPFTRSPWP